MECAYEPSLKDRVCASKSLFSEFNSNRGNFQTLWKGFVWGLDLVKKGIRKNVGNGLTIKLFKDPWIPRPSSFKVIPLMSEDDEQLVADYITPTGHWNIPFLKERLC